jgi:hypothetical protein
MHSVAPVQVPASAQFASERQNVVPASVPPLHVFWQGAAQSVFVVQVRPVLGPTLHLRGPLQVPDGQSVLRLHVLPAFPPPTQVGRHGPAAVGVQSSSVVQARPSRSPPAQTGFPPLGQSLSLAHECPAKLVATPSSQGVPFGSRPERGSAAQVPP